MRITFIGLTITSSWGNGHVTTYRALLRELVAAGHEVVFLEHDKPWYAEHRDLPEPPFGRTVLYPDVEALKREHVGEVREADAVVVGSYVPQGVEVGKWALATATGPVVFYDIDTPVTLAKLGRADYEYLTPTLIGRYAAYLSFSAGPTLERLEREFGSPMARALHCSVDPTLYHPEPADDPIDLNYLGTYSPDRQPPLQRLLIEPARQWGKGRFEVAGPNYPADVEWPANVRRVDHCPPAEHRTFYNSARFTLNVTRADMVAAGWSPSVRLFEAAACGVPMISDRWDGLGDYFPLNEQIFVADTTEQALAILRDLPEPDRRSAAEAARQTVLQHHTAEVRAAELITFLREAGAAG
jgi:spore maturation protein CgeB